MLLCLKIHQLVLIIGVVKKNLYRLKLKKTYRNDTYIIICVSRQFCPDNQEGLCFLGNK